MDEGEIDGEARIPTAPALSVIAGDVGHIFDGRAETGGANHRTVGAGQAPFRHMVPARMVEVFIEQIANPGGFHPPGLLAGGGLNGRAGRVAIFLTAWLAV